MDQVHTAVTGVTLRVLTLNVWSLEGESARQAHLRDGIRALRPDLLALQEVARTGQRDQLAELLAGSGLHAAHQLDVLEGDASARRFGTALASRWQPTAIDGIDLSAGALQPLHPCTTQSVGDARSQCALAATIPLPIGLDLLFIAVKPAWRLDAEAGRVAQARAIAQLDSRRRGPVPTIIAGDFDATPDSDSIRFLTGRAAVDGRSAHYHDAWAVAGTGGEGHTWASENRLAEPLIDQLIGQRPHARRIDYILVGSQHVHRHATARVRTCHVVLTDPPVSDHYGVLAEIDLEPAQPDAPSP